MRADIQRWVLLIGLFIVAYLLAQKWHEDYGGNPVPVESGNDIPNIYFPETTEPPSSKDNDSDIPQIEPTTSTPRVVDSGYAQRLVRIETDSLILLIDRMGGDIVSSKLRKFPVNIASPDVPITLMEQTNSRTYIAQSGLLGLDNNTDGRPLYQSSQAVWTLQPGQASIQVPFEYIDAEGNEFTKIFTINRDTYVIEVSYRIKNNSTKDWNGNFYAQFKHDGKKPLLKTTSGFGPTSYVGAALTTPDSRYEKLDFDSLNDAPYELNFNGGWLAVLQHYFISAWISNGEESNRYYGRKSADGTYLVGFVSAQFTVAPGTTGTHTKLLYMGPKYQSVLAELAPNLDLTIDYGFLWWLAQPLFIMLKLIEGFVGNWGFAIIVLTLFIKVLLYPLSEMAYRSMARMRKLSPHMKRLQERHAGDRQKLSQEMMGLYRKEKINPLGGCLPMLMQMPVFIALYWVLYESVELRHAPFIFWIKDLASLDDFFILPILMGVTMFLQQMLNPPVPDPVQAKVMKALPIIFTIFFAFFPSGLVLYWLINNILSIGQQWIANKRIEGGVSSTATKSKAKS